MEIKRRTFKEVYYEGKKLLKQNNIECYNSDVLWILKECFGLGRYDLLLKYNDYVHISDAECFFNMIQRRISGEPVQYIVGHCEFMDLDFEVGPGVLIPRDDTEVLVRESIKIIETMSNTGKKLKIFDLCSGTGVIAISIKDKFGDKTEIYALESSEDAYKYLKKNAYKHNKDINIIKNDIFNYYNEIKNEEIDFIISNPPYIPSGDLEKLDDVVKKEPIVALDGGKDGLVFYHKICEKWSPKIKKGGFIAFEIGINQGSDVKNILESNGFGEISIHKDINNIQRVIIGKKKKRY